VARAEFEEKEYEHAATAELRDSSAGRGFAMSSGQVIEEILAYDAVAAPPDRHVIWEVLAVPRPRGIRLVPKLWTPGKTPPAHRLPQTPISLVLQYKRPEFLHGPQARQRRLWGQPYFRFERTRHQHAVLLRLERSLGDEAVVRYAAPAFHTVRELEAALLTREVLARSGFVSPTDFGRHQIWTYVEPGVDGRGNPSGREQPFQTFDRMWRDLTDPPASSTALVRGRGFDEHLTRLQVAAVDREPTIRRGLERWQAALLDADLPVSPTTVGRIVAVASIVSVTAAVGATWQLWVPDYDQGG